MEDILIKFYNEIKFNSHVGEYDELLNMIEMEIDNLWIEKAKTKDHNGRK